MKLIVQDNFLSEEERQNIDLCKMDITWYDLGNYNHMHGNLCMNMLNYASLHFDITNHCGYELWSQYNTKPSTWHYDKDEFIKETGVLAFPICSIIYYPYVDVISGGNLLIECGTEIAPKTNRLVLFSPGVYHSVEHFEGERVSILINPWTFIPSSHNR